MALGGFAAGLLLSAIAASLAESFPGQAFRPGDPVPVAVSAANLVGLWAGLMGAVLYASRAGGTKRLSADFGARVGAWWELPLGAATGLACQWGLVPLLYLPLTAGHPGVSHQLARPTHQDTAAAHGAPTKVVILVLFALGAPLVEELFFRGLVLRSIARLAPAPVAVAGSGVLFALAHFEALQFLGLAAFGVILGVLAWWTGRLAAPAAAHVAFNASAVVSATHLLPLLH